MPFLDMETIGYDTVNNKAVFVDQTQLPAKYIEVFTDDFDEMYEAVKNLRVRGAPAIGVFAAISLAVLVNKTNDKDLKKQFFDYADRFISCRPTAVNLAWAIKKCKNTAENSDDIQRDLKNLALQMIEEDIQICRQIGENGAKLLSKCNAVLTHCNAGRLATVKYGTALAPIYIAKEKGHNISVYADETRPLLQGARLTCYELQTAGVDTTLICDNAASAVMKKGLVDAVVVGCDRVALNGDTANKVGTSVLAILASEYNIPFYVCMPFSTFDKDIKDGSQIPIEERNSDEIISICYKENIVAKGVKTLNYAFDVTDHKFITAFVTEKGIIKPSEIRNYCKN